MKHLVSINQLSTEDILRLLDRAALFEQNPNRKLLEGHVIATLFFEPSTRTRLSFETAVNRLDQHPSQTLLDLYAIRKTQGTLYDKTIALVGDLKYGRTVHSLIVGMAPFRPRFIFVSPPELMMPEECKDFCRRAGIPFTETTDFTPEVIRSVDVLYMTRVQRERFIDLEEYERVKNVYVLTSSMLEGCREHLRILHPLPRVGEIAQDVDDTPYAYYVEQAQGGLYVRQSILCEVLGLEVND